MAYLRRQLAQSSEAELLRACGRQAWMPTWWRRPAEPREGSVCPTRKKVDGQIWALCRQTGPFPLGRFEEGLRDPEGEKIEQELC